jgi:antitoxin Phd
MGDKKLSRQTTTRRRKSGKAATMTKSSNHWQVQDAKARFSEVFRRALRTPQEIRRHNRDGVVMINVDEFDRLKGRSGAPNIVALVQNSPLHGLILKLKRERDPGREIEL